MITKPQDLDYGGSEWSAQFKCAIGEVVTGIVSRGCQRASKKGNPTYFADDEGFLCVMMPDGHERRLTDIEIKDLTR
jgi:hypothetical protein